MSVLYLIEPQSIVHKDGGRFVVKKGGNILQSVHIFKLEQVIVAGSVTLTTPVIKTLLSEGIDTVFTSMNGRYYGRLQGPDSKNITLRKAQFNSHNSPEFCLNFAKSVVLGKLRNQKTILGRIQKNQKKLDLAQPIAKISNLFDHVQKAESIDEVRGHEGRAAAIYFPAWAQGIKADGISFTSRQRRPPRDPVNGLLSLGYTFLLHAIGRAVDIAGLDPYLGILHTVDYGRPSLVLDLMEEWRPALIDSLVMSAFNLGVLTKDDFREEQATADEDTTCVQQESATENSTEGSDEPAQTVSNLPAVRLTNAGWRKFVGQYERRMAEEVTFHIDGMQRTYRDTIMSQIRHFVQHVKGDTAQYMPFPIK